MIACFSAVDVAGTAEAAEKISKKKKRNCQNSHWRKQIGFIHLFSQPKMPTNWSAQNLGVVGVVSKDLIHGLNTLYSPRLVRPEAWPYVGPGVRPDVRLHGAAGRPAKRRAGCPAGLLSAAPVSAAPKKKFD